MKIQKLAVLIASGVLVLCVCGVGMTYALLKHVTDEKVNEFAPGTVSQDIVRTVTRRPTPATRFPTMRTGPSNRSKSKTPAMWTPMCG